MGNHVTNITHRETRKPSHVRGTGKTCDQLQSLYIGLLLLHFKLKRLIIFRSLYSMTQPIYIFLILIIGVNSFTSNFITDLCGIPVN